LRVLHLEAGTHVYGGALQVFLLVEGLCGRGVENVLVVPLGAETEREARVRGLPVHPIPLAGEADLRFPLRFRALIRKMSPDLVHLHSRRGADTLGTLGTLGTGIPVLLTRRVDNPEPSWLAAPKYRIFDRIITISEAIRRVLLAEGVPAEKLRCVPSALDPAPFKGPCRGDAFRAELGLDAQAPIIGMAAQFIPRKGHDTFLQAMPSILHHHPDAQVVLLGQGPLRDDVARQIRQMGLHKAVHLPGFRKDLPDLLPCLSVLVHPATMEGLGIILLQAAASGVPIVASRAGGIPEAVLHERTGLLVPPGDPVRLAQAVIDLLATPDRARAMGEAGRARVIREFSVDRMVDGNLAVYEELVNR
jgi:glycosyltransferase involved in cell wall biosynthesis